MSTTVALPARIGRRAGLWTLLSWVVVGVVVWRGVVVLAFNLRLTQAGLGPWGPDFHGGAWLAAGQILRGVSPYVAPDPGLLSHLSHALVTPPGIALGALPLAHLPYGVAVGLWNLVDLVGLAAALWLLEVRDLRMYLLAIFSAPFINSVTSGQVEGVFALVLALAWRLRGSSLGAVAVGTLIAAKLYAFPLMIWLLATRRFRSALVASGSAAVLLMLSWAVIDFHGLAEYPQLLAAASTAAQKTLYSQSIVTLALHSGMGQPLATALGAVFGVLVTLAIVLAGRASDESWFTATLIGGLLASPILWDHYLVLLFVPLAISRPRQIEPWLMTALVWAVFGLDLGPMREALTLLVTAAIAVVTCAVWAGGGASRPMRRPPTLTPARAASNPQ